MTEDYILTERQLFIECIDQYHAQLAGTPRCSLLESIDSCKVAR